MPNLDELSHEMTFTIGGETFEIHDVEPDVIEAWETEADVEGETTMQRLDRHILAFLNGDPASVKRWKDLRKRKAPNVVPAWKIVEFHNLLMETQTGRPTNPPSPSAPGPGRTAPTSEAA